MDLLLKNIGLLASPQGKKPLRGKEQAEIRTIKNAAIGINGSKIVYVGEDSDSLTAKKIVDCEGRLATPGLVDAHTHLVFGGWRQNELPLKLAGKSYLEILQSGGGILSTVRQTRASTQEQLIEKGLCLLSEMLAHGTTTCECKSGYGLNLETELKQLRVMSHLNQAQCVDLVPTFMGAHALPEEFTDDREAYIDLICDVMLPKIADESLAESCDVFCESSVFTADESRRVLSRAKELGLFCKAHIDEISPIGGVNLAVDPGCISVEHLIQTTDDGIDLLSGSGTIACLLPATSFCLDKPYARARKMIDSGLAVAIGSDFNPGSSPNLNLQLAMYLACSKAKMTPHEVLTAVTLNSAAAVNRCETVGSLEEGKQADIVLWNAPDLDYLFYRFGSNLAHTVIKGGVLQKSDNATHNDSFSI